MCNVGYQSKGRSGRAVKRSGPTLAYKFAYDRGPRYKKRFVPLYRDDPSYYYGMESEAILCPGLNHENNKYPASGCMCGFHAFDTPYRASQEKIYASLSHSLHGVNSKGGYLVMPLVLLEVELRNVVVHYMGYRAKYQTVKKIIPVDSEEYHNVRYYGRVA